MDKFKFTIVHNWKELRIVIIYTFSVAALLYAIVNIYSCSDDTFIAGYNKDMEEIHQQMFEVDSLLMKIQMEADSLAKRN
jgi:hypothetical protein|tara:strand:- start:437 stop:676 length:240 start_codon:yes stop_codon:yes gene_type:complete